MGGRAQIAARLAAVISLALVMAVGSVASAGVAKAGWDPGDYGTEPTCRYRTIDLPNYQYAYRLRRIVVYPPTSLYAREPSQLVGWRFYLKVGDGTSTEMHYRRIFASRVEKSLATPDRAGVFEPMVVRIR